MRLPATVRISLGAPLVNGNIRLPRPAAGITAFLNIGADIHKSLSSLDAIYARPQPSCAVPRLSNNRIYRRNNIIVKTPAEVCATMQICDTIAPRDCVGQDLYCRRGFSIRLWDRHGISAAVPWDDDCPKRQYP